MGQVKAHVPGPVSEPVAVWAGRQNFEENLLVLGGMKEHAYQARDKSTYLVHCHKKHHQEITCYSLKSFRSCAVVLLFLRFIYYFHSENGFDSYQLNRDYNLLHWNSQLARILVVLLFFYLTPALCTWQPRLQDLRTILLTCCNQGTAPSII
jgi:hypothetical protein